MDEKTAGRIIALESELEMVHRDRDYWMARYTTDILCFKDENSHLRKMNQRLIEALVEMAPLAPLKPRVICED